MVETHAGLFRAAQEYPKLDRVIYFHYFFPASKKLIPDVQVICGNGNAISNPLCDFFKPFNPQSITFFSLTMSTTASEKHVSKRGCLKSRRSRIALAVVIFIVILAAVIPPVVVTTLRKKNSMGPKSKVFVPLYVYPAPGAWTPLEEVYVSPFQSSPGPVPRSPLLLPRKSIPISR